MNLPNKLTLSRIIMVPFVVALIIYPIIPDWFFINRWLVVAIVFCLSAITDALDGYIARKRGLVTDLGKLLDPVADKLLVVGTLVALVTIGKCSPWIIIITLFREFLVTSMRMIAAGKGKIIAANKWGKIKTVSQILSIITIIVVEYIKYIYSYYSLSATTNLITGLDILTQALLWLSVAITIISGWIYLYDNRKVFIE